MVSASVIPLVIVALAAAAASTPMARIDKPPVTLALSRRLNLTSAHKIVRQDQARAHTFRLNGKSTKGGVKSTRETVSNVPVLNEAVAYVATVGVGSPATKYNLIIDTGSSNTWVGAATPYIPTRTSTRTLNDVHVSYGSGDFTGVEYLDTVDVGGGLMIPGQSIGVAFSDEGFDGVDGIIGIGPTDLTVGTLVPLLVEPVPTVTDNLFKDGLVPAKEVGVFFQPTTSADENPDGQITWGGVDTSKMTADLTWIPVTSMSPANMYWGIDQSITYGGSTILSKTAGIVDTGTTLVLIASDAFLRYQQAINAVADADTGLLRITTAQFSSLQSLFFNAGGSSFELTPNAQVWPRSLNAAIGGSEAFIYLIVADLGSPSGEGLDFINGMSFLQRFYSAYDSTNKRVGLAPTQFTNSETN